MRGVLRQWMWVWVCAWAMWLGGAVGASALPGWHTNFVAAQAEAKAQGKRMLVHFSGSDWCGWCMKLKKDVYQKPEFQGYARSNLVLLTVDFPKRKALPPAVQAANQALAQKYHVEGFPTLLLLNPDGAKLGLVNFGDGGPKTFIREVEKALARRETNAAPMSTSAILARAKAVPRGGLQLSGIVGKPGRRTAQINGQNLSAGQSARIRVASGEVAVRLLEIRDASVLVKVDGRKEPLELKLPERL